MIAIVGYLVLAAIAAVLCWSRRGRALLAGAGDALAVIVDELRGGETAAGESHVERLGAWAAERDRENAARCRYRPTPPPAPPAPLRGRGRVAQMRGFLLRHDPRLRCDDARCQTCRSLTKSRFDAIQSSQDEQWVM